MKSYSQSAQDKFVISVLGDMPSTFLDVGCSHPINISNTFSLEQEFGWIGCLIDNDPGAVELCRKHRSNPVILGDAVNINWAEVLDATIPKWRGAPIGYLSLDIDEASFDALTAILNVGSTFNVITAEHDLYRNGPRLRGPMRERLENNGYVLICADVCSSEGLPFEDWWVAPELSKRADRFRCTNKRWPEIFK